MLRQLGRPRAAVVRDLRQPVNDGLARRRAQMLRRGGVVAGQEVAEDVGRHVMVDDHPFQPLQIRTDVVQIAQFERGKDVTCLLYTSRCV